MTKEKQIVIMKRNLKFAERKLGSVVLAARNKPGSFEAQASAVLVKKYHNEIKNLRRRLALINKN